MHQSEASPLVSDLVISVLAEIDGENNKFEIFANSGNKKQLVEPRD